MYPAPKMDRFWNASLDFIKRPQTKSKSWSGPKTPKFPKASKVSKPPKHPESHLRQTAGDQEQKFIECEDPESHLRQTAWDQAQKISTSSKTNHEIVSKSIDFTKNRSNWKCSNYPKVGYQTVTHHFEMSSLLRDLSKLLFFSAPSAKVDKPESRPGQGRQTEPGTGPGTSPGTGPTGTAWSPRKNT